MAAKTRQMLINETVKSAMNPLNQTILEQMLQGRLPEQATHNIIYFTASWCGPCNSLALDRLVAQHPHVRWYICDVDDDHYLPGYCGVRTVPSFLGIVHAKATPLHSGADLVGIAKWMIQYMSIPRK